MKRTILKTVIVFLNVLILLAFFGCKEDDPDTRADIFSVFLYEDGVHIPTRFELVEAGGFLTVTDPVRNGYTFGGWFFDSGFVNRCENINAFRINSDTNFFARWLKEEPPVLPPLPPEPIGLRTEGFENTVFCLCEEVEITALSVFLEYSDGSERELDGTEYTKQLPESFTEGKNTVVVLTACGSFDTSFDFYRISKVHGFSVSDESSITLFRDGDYEIWDFNIDDREFFAEYCIDDIRTVELDPDMVSLLPTEEAGLYEIIFEYGGKQIFIGLEVRQIELVGLRTNAEDLEDGLTAVRGTVFSLSGFPEFKVFAILNNGAELSIERTDLVQRTVNTSNEGEAELRIEYRGFFVLVPVRIVPVTAVRIFVAQMPAVGFSVGAKPDFSGLTVSRENNVGARVQVHTFQYELFLVSAQYEETQLIFCDITFTIENLIFSSAGTKTILVRHMFEGTLFETTFDIEVRDAG
jgi:uncharacterized repeat protein (TIGR02543 family)